MLPALLISLVLSALTLAAVIGLLRRQRKQLEKIVMGFGDQNVTMARKLTEIMLSQQKKQDAQEQAIEKVAGHALKMRQDINTLAEYAAEDEEFYATVAPEIKRVH